VPLAAGAVKREEPDIDVYVSGKCTKLRIAGSDFGRKAVAFPWPATPRAFHEQQ
jgi:hypothetical protein